PRYALTSRLRYIACSENLFTLTYQEISRTNAASPNSAIKNAPSLSTPESGAKDSINRSLVEQTTTATIANPSRPRVGNHLSGVPNIIRSPGVALLSRPEEQRGLAPILLTTKAVKPPAAAIAAWIFVLTKASPRAPNNTRPVTISQPPTAS